MLWNTMQPQKEWGLSLCIDLKKNLQTIEYMKKKQAADQLEYRSTYETGTQNKATSMQ